MHWRSALGEVGEEKKVAERGTSGKRSKASAPVGVGERERVVSCPGWEGVARFDGVELGGWGFALPPQRRRQEGLWATACGALGVAFFCALLAPPPFSSLSLLTSMPPPPSLFSETARAEKRLASFN